MEEDDRGRRWRKTMEEDDGGRRWRKTMEEDDGGRRWRKTMEEDDLRTRFVGENQVYQPMGIRKFALLSCPSNVLDTERNGANLIDRGQIFVNYPSDSNNMTEE